MSLPDAIRSMTSLPATLFGLKDRGQLRAGALADVLIFDLAKVNDAATYQEPHQLAEGHDRHPGQRPLGAAQRSVHDDAGRAGRRSGPPVIRRTLR